MRIFARSLSQTVDSVHESTFFHLNTTAAERLAVARWIAGRQGLPGAYGEMFALFDPERKAGIHLFTGERTTSASARHIAGEENCRALRQLGVRNPTVLEKLDCADAGMMKCLEASQRESIGWFCCGKCTVGLWRNLLAGGLDRPDERIASGVKVLKRHRMERGWRRFPFWYTVLALEEIRDPAATAELRHAAPVLERAAAKRAGDGIYPRRRKALAERALARL